MKFRKRFTHSDTTGSTDYKRMRFDLNSTVSGKILYPQYCENKNEGTFTVWVPLFGQNPTTLSYRYQLLQQILNIWLG